MQLVEYFVVYTCRDFRGKLRFHNKFVRITPAEAYSPETCIDALLRNIKKTSDEVTIINFFRLENQKPSDENLLYVYFVSFSIEGVNGSEIYNGYGNSTFSLTGPLCSEYAHLLYEHEEDIRSQIMEKHESNACSIDIIQVIPLGTKPKTK